jgi:hypothetical protein
MAASLMRCFPQSPTAFTTARRGAAAAPTLVVDLDDTVMYR